MGCVQAKPTSPTREQLEMMKVRYGYQPSSKLRSSSSKNMYRQKENERERPRELEKEISEKPRENDWNNEKNKSRNKSAYTIGDAAVAPEELQVKEVESNPGNNTPPNALEQEQAADGWPRWLTKIAGDALKDWTPRSAESYDKLDKIGQGTYSNVYKARDRETGKIVALKKVRFDTSEQESVRFMAREIRILRRLDHPNIVKLEGLATSRMQYSLYLVFEYMQSDLSGIISRLDVNLTEPQVKCYMQQLLRGLEHCHERGVLHRDIKGSNLLVDKDGTLKIADFGLATIFEPNQKQPLTNRVVTLWYRPPELLLGVQEYAEGVDLWSAGCLLAELFIGKPVMPGRTEVEQLHKIFKLCGSPSEEYWKKLKLPNTTMFKPQHAYKCNLAETFKDFPSSSLSLLSTLLAIEPADRGTASAALKSEFFHTSPFACDPSSLPRFHQAKDSELIVPNEGKRNRSGKLRSGRSHKHRGGRNNIGQNVIKNAQDDFAVVKEEQLQAMTDEAKSRSKSQDLNSNLDNTSTSKSSMRPQRGYTVSSMSTLNVPIKQSATRSELHPEGKNNAIPEAWNSSLTRRSVSVSDFKTFEREGKPVKLVSLTDSPGESTK